MTCTFFGNGDAPDTIKEVLKATIINLIENKNVKVIYVGNQGNFDLMVYKILESLSEKYDINYFVVLAYIPTKKQEDTYYKIDRTILFEGIEKTNPRYAISYRNKYMLKKSDIVVTYVKHNFGGAYKFKKLAEKLGKDVVEISSNVL